MEGLRGQELRAATNHQPVSSQSSQACSYKELNSASNLSELGGGVFPSQTSRGEHRLADILTAAL